MQTRIINRNDDVSSGDVDSGVSLANYDNKENEGNKHHVVNLDTTLDVSSSSDDHSNIDGRNSSDSRVVMVDDMNDNSNKQMSTPEKEEKLTPSLPSHDSTVANNCNIMSSESIAKHNKMIDDQSSTTADDDKNVNKEEDEVVTSDNVSIANAANVSSSTTRCKSSNDDNDNQPSHNLEDTQSTTTTANLQNNNNNTTTKVIVDESKKGTIQQRATTNNNQKGGGPYSSSSSHIYALREIIYSSSSSSNGNDDVSPTTASYEEVQYNLLDNEEEEKKECSRPIYHDITNDKENNKVVKEEYHHPRIITSQIVKTNQDTYKLLECNTAGKVLCPCKQQHGNSSSSSTNDDEANEVMLTDTNGINFTACNVSSILNQIKNIDIDGSSGCDCTTFRMMKNCPISLSSNERCGDTTTLPTKKKKYLPINIYKSIKQLCQRSPIKQRRAKKEQHKKPKMVIKNGIIDWTSCQNLENCNNIDEHMLTVEYMNGSAHDEERGVKKQQKKKGKNRQGKNRKGKKKGDRGGIELTSSICSSRDGTTTLPEEMKSLGSTIFSDESVSNNTIKPINEVVCINKSLGIYVSESGLSASDCRNIINVSEHTATIRGSWSSYTYAKQTLGCRENDALAFVCARPVMIACATICKHLIEEEDTDDDEKEEGEKKKKKTIHDDDDNDATTDHGKVPPSSDLDGCKPSSCKGDDDLDTPVQNEDTKKKELVLDVREPHVVKYDTSKTERQKLDMHTDKSVWTFLIALSEGRGEDYGGGGTYFQALNSTVHLQRSQMIIFRGKRRHCGVAINSGCRYLLVGFLVPSDGMVTTTKKKTDSKST